MNVTMNTGAGPIASAMRKGRFAAPGEKAAGTAQDSDAVSVSQEGRDAAAQSPGEQWDGFSHRLDTVLSGMTKDEFMDMVQTWRDEQTAKAEAGGEDWKGWRPLVENPCAEVDPDGSVAAKAYMEALVSQAKQAESEIRTYYAPALEEARSNPMGNPLLYIAAKYQCSWSDHFDASMPADQRQWTYSQLKAMLTGSRVALNDPYALAASGGPRTAEDMEKTARQAAKNALDALVQKRDQ